MDERNGPPAGGPPEIGNRRRVLANTGMSILQVVVVGLTFVLLYRFVRDQIGVDQFGVWALVLTTTSVANLANLGLTTGTVKFVAQYLANEDHQHVSRLIQTAVISVAAVVGVVALIGYPVALELLAFLIEPSQYFADAAAILPYALVSFWLTAIAAVIQSSLDGHHRVYLRNLLLIGSSVLYLILAYVLVPTRGLLGLALAQTLQAAVLLIVAWILIVRVARELPVVPTRWNRSAFREMLGYSLNLQVISISQILFVPVTKALVSKFGSVGAVGSFEFAYRMVIQLRALFATAHEALVPALSDLFVRDRDRVRAVYIKSFRLLLFLLTPVLPLLVILTPTISLVWIGSLDPQFVIFADLLLAGWFLTFLANPAYFANLGTGDLTWNVRGHLIIGASSAILGIALGWWFGATGVVLAFSGSLLLGSFLIGWDYQRRHGVRAADLLDARTGQLVAASLLAVAAAWLFLTGDASEWPGLTTVLAACGLYLLIVAAPLWRHPMRREFSEWVAGAISARSAQTP